MSQTKCLFTAMERIGFGIKKAFSYVLFAILYPLCFIADTDRSTLKPDIQVSFFFMIRVLVLEIGLLLLDIFTDFLNGGKYIWQGLPFIGTITIIMVFVPGVLRAITILDLYRQGKLDLSRVGLVEGQYSRSKLVLTLTRVCLSRILFFPLLPVTMFLKSLFVDSEPSFKKSFEFGITDKFLESFCEAGPQMLLSMTVLFMDHGGHLVSWIMVAALSTSTFSVAKTAAEAHVMLSSAQIPKISQWIKVFPFFLLTTLTRGLTLAILASYIGFYYTIIPVAVLMLTNVLMSYFVSGMPVGMVCLNSGPSALLSSLHFSTVPLANVKSNLRTLKFFLWNAVSSFLILGASIASVILLLENQQLSYSPEDVPFLSCLNGTQHYVLESVCAQSYGKAHLSHEPLYKIALPALSFLWAFCFLYAIMIYPLKVAFPETYEPKVEPASAVELQNLMISQQPLSAEVKCSSFAFGINNCHKISFPQNLSKATSSYL